MFSRFDGISHEEYGLRTAQNGKGKMVGQIGQVSHPVAQAPGVTPWVKPGSKKLGQTTMTRPMCLCKMQREQDAARAAKKNG